MIRTGKIKETDSVLFWHTGGAPALFAYANELDLAKKPVMQKFNFWHEKFDSLLIDELS